jgi:hypothetical protein
MTDKSLQPCARIPLFRGEVKDHCASIVQIGFLTLPNKVGQSIVQIAERQLSHYHYIYPTAGHVSATFSVGHSSWFGRATLSSRSPCVQGLIGTHGSLPRSGNCTSKGGGPPSLSVLNSMSIYLLRRHILLLI